MLLSILPCVSYEALLVSSSRSPLEMQQQQGHIALVWRYSIMRRVKGVTWTFSMVLAWLNGTNAHKPSVMPTYSYDVEIQSRHMNIPQTEQDDRLVYWPCPGSRQATERFVLVTSELSLILWFCGVKTPKSSLGITLYIIFLKPYILNIALSHVGIRRLKRKSLIHPQRYKVTQSLQGHTSSLHQGCHAITRNKWKACSVPRQRGTTNTQAVVSSWKCPFDFTDHFKL